MLCSVERDDMEAEVPMEISDVPEYVRDLSERWRHIDELQKEINRTPDDSPLYQRLVDQYATAVGDACYLED